MTTPSSAPGETSLVTLLATTKLVLDPEIFVFITLPGQQAPPPSLPIQMCFREAEGLTIITTQAAAASNGFEYIFPCKMITLNVHSSLEAVGFMAVISAKLAGNGIGVNPVSGYFHDHCFVPLGKEDEAMKVLEELVEDARSKV